MSRRRYLSLAYVAILILSLASPLLAEQPRQDDPAARLLERMPPAARVGQLFIVTFPGTDTGELSTIASLISEERIGGVLLRPENGNIVNEGNTPAQVAALTNSLQQLAVQASQTPIPLTGESGTGATFAPLVPLFIAVEQSGDGSPETAIVSGTTPLPSPMAIGASWNPDHAEAVGAIVGDELSALGLNMLLGPSLDVLNTPRPGSAADLGVQSFGGDPYWVGQMGAAYVRGVHEGSDGRVSVIGSHFPGLGTADRPLSEEVSTVQKSLEQLKQIELAPFFAVAAAEDPLARSDGFLVSHIRYRGFQGNIRFTTKPVSFDPQALQQLMALPELAPWREEGGLTVADELGVRAVRRFYDPTETEFNSIRIAHDAFLAGNDLLILSHFALDDNWDTQADNIRSTIAFFREKYDTDATFQAWVDESVLRILRLKYELYGTFTSNSILVDEESATDQIGTSLEGVVPVARDAITLLSPPSPDLRPPPPAAEDWVVIFTDDRLISPCADCSPVPTIPSTLIEETMVNLYGPQATDQVDPARVSSFTFGQLIEYMDTPPPIPVEPEGEATPIPPQPVAVAIERADWVVFAMLNISEQAPSSNAVRRFLAEQGDLLRTKQSVVFAFGAPYYLDTTEIAKLSMYYGLYSHIDPFVETAVRALFDEFAPTGAAPVSIAGINYDLIAQTQPDPTQIIELYVGEETAEGTPQPAPVLSLGDAIRLRTSVVVDRNGHRVPDGTPVEFIFTYAQEGLELTIQKTTQDGIATTGEAEVILDRPGHLQISVRAEPAPRAVRLELDIPEGSPATIISVTPSPEPSPPPSPLPTVAPTPEVTPAPEAESEDGRVPGRLPGLVDWLDLGQTILAAAATAAAGYVSIWLLRHSLPSALRSALCTLAGGLIGYIGLALGMPGSGWLIGSVADWAPATVTLVGSLTALLVSTVYDVVTERRSSSS